MQRNLDSTRSTQAIYKPHGLISHTIESYDGDVVLQFVV